MDSWLAGRRVSQRPRRWLAAAGPSVCLGGIAFAALFGFAACSSGEEGEQGEEAFSLSLQVPSEARAGETVPLTLIAKNVTDAPVELGLGGIEPAFCPSFVVSTSDGVDVWSYMHGDLPEFGACPAVLSPKTLGPGEELVLSGEWKQTDNNSVLVASGRYLVRGILNIRLDLDTPREREMTLQTEAKPLVIVGEQEAQPLSLSLQVPSPVQAGEPVRLRLIAKNVTDSPVELGLWGPPDFCRDFTVSTADGGEVWRFLDTVQCHYFSRISFAAKTLGPGEELILEGEWDQTDTRGAPVAAGSYLVRGFLPSTLNLNTLNERVLAFQSEEEPLVIQSQ